MSATPGQHADDVLSAQAIHFASVHGWAYSTTADCYGHEPSNNDLYDWCLFDPDEDDPPIISGLDPEGAQALYEILTWVARRHSDGRADAT